MSSWKLSEKTGSNACSTSEKSQLVESEAFRSQLSMNCFKKTGLRTGTFEFWDRHVNIGTSCEERATIDVSSKKWTATWLVPKRSEASQTWQASPENNPHVLCAAAKTGSFATGSALLKRLAVSRSSALHTSNTLAHVATGDLPPKREEPLLHNPRSPSCKVVVWRQSRIVLNRDNQPVRLPTGWFAFRGRSWWAGRVREAPGFRRAE